MKNVGTTLRGGYTRFHKQYIETFKIKQVTEHVDKKLHDEIVKLVEQILKLNADLKIETLPNRIEQLQYRIEYIESKIDQIVYQLYELTPEEIKLVEAR